MKYAMLVVLLAPSFTLAQEPEEQVPYLAWAEVRVTEGRGKMLYDLALHFDRDDTETTFSKYMYRCVATGRETFRPFNARVFTNSKSNELRYKCEIREGGSWMFDVDGKPSTHSQAMLPFQFGCQESEGKYEKGRVPGPIERVEIQVYLREKGDRNGPEYICGKPVGPLHVFVPAKGYQHVLTRETPK